MISGPLVPALAAIYLLASLVAIVYVFVCLARITAALQGIASSLLRMEAGTIPRAADGAS